MEEKKKKSCQFPSWSSVLLFFFAVSCKGIGLVSWVISKKRGNTRTDRETDTHTKEDYLVQVYVPNQQGWDAKKKWKLGIINFINSLLVG